MWLVFGVSLNTPQNFCNKFL